MQLTRRDALLQTLALAGASALRPAAAAAPQPAPRNPDIDSILQGAVSAKGVPGVVAMAATDRTVIYEGAFGLRCLGTQAKMSTDTVFRIASMVKLLTSVAAMQLVESGKLSLDDPADKVDPELAAIPVLTGFDAKGNPQLRPPLRPITLRNLLTHTSGFSYPLWDENCGALLRGRRQDQGPAAPAAVLRSRQQMVLWRQHRQGRTAGGDRKRRAARPLLPQSHLSAARE